MTPLQGAQKYLRGAGWLALLLALTVAAVVVHAMTVFFLRNWVTEYGHAHDGFGVSLALIAAIGIIASFWLWIAAIMGLLAAAARSVRGPGPSRGCVSHEGMTLIPVGVFQTGSVAFYPEEGPVTTVEVDSLGSMITQSPTPGIQAGATARRTQWCR